MILTKGITHIYDLHNSYHIHTSVVCNKGVLKHLAPWDKFWSEGIEKFFHKNCLIFWSKYLNQFSIKIIHRLDIVQNFYKFWGQNVSIPQEIKFFNSPMLYTTDAHFYNSSLKIGSIYFFSSSDMYQSHHPLGYHATGINSSLIFFFKFFAFFKFNMPSQKSDKNSSIRINSIKVIIKINIIKIYIKNTYFITRKYYITRI